MYCTCLRRLKKPSRVQTNSPEDAIIRHTTLVRIKTIILVSTPDHLVLLQALVHYGEFRESLNLRLLSPFTRYIAKKWCKVFEAQAAQLFAQFETDIFAVINKLLSDVEDSGSHMESLRGRIKVLKEAVLQDVNAYVHRTISKVDETLKSEQRTISRSIALNLKNCLVPGYQRAAAESGKGMSARQKVSNNHCYCIIAMTCCPSGNLP